jgi:hypothetical protein
MTLICMFLSSGLVELTGAMLRRRYTSRDKGRRSFDALGGRREKKEMYDEVLCTIAFDAGGHEFSDADDGAA